MSATLEIKDPTDVKDYAIEWLAVLAADGEAAISTSVWGVSSPAGLTVQSSPAPSIVGTKAVLWVSLGTAGQNYTLTNTITTPGGRTHQRSIEILCRER